MAEENFYTREKEPKGTEKGKLILKVLSLSSNKDYIINQKFLTNFNLKVVLMFNVRNFYQDD